MFGERFWCRLGRLKWVGVSDVGFRVDLVVREKVWIERLEKFIRLDFGEGIESFGWI